MDDHDTLGGAFPFAPHLHTVDGIRLHYVDEGEGEPVVMLHGNPTWSFLYRNFIPPLAEAGFRAIAPDQMGFGKSDKPPDAAAYTYGRHVHNFSSLMLHLDVRNATLVVSDWGIIALSFAADYPDRVKRLVLLNVRPGPFPEGHRMPGAFHLFREPMTGELLIQGANLFVEGLIPYGMYRKERVTQALLDAYRAPLPDYASRVGILTFARMHPIGESHPDYVREKRTTDAVARFRGPVLLVGVPNDHAYGQWAYDAWRQRLPGAECHVIEEAFHFVQEDAYEVLVPLIIDFLRRNR